MSITLDYQLREKMPHDAASFPISFFRDELASLPNLAGPLHWHPEFEIATAESGVLEYQVGQERIVLEYGDSIFVNGNMPNVTFALPIQKPTHMLRGFFCAKNDPCRVDGRGWIRQMNYSAYSSMHWR